MPGTSWAAEYRVRRDRSIFSWQLITTLALLFGAYALVDGVIALVCGISVSHRVWALVLEGVFGILVGIAAFLWPHLTAEMMVGLIASWYIATAVLELVAASWLRIGASNRLWLAIGSTCSLGLGVALFLLPRVELVALSWLFGTYALGFGLLLVWLGLVLRQLYGSSSRQS